MLGMVVGVTRAARGTVVAQMVGAARPVGKTGVEPERQLTQAVVGPGPAREEQAVHGVVPDDEQPGVQY